MFADWLFGNTHTNEEDSANLARQNAQLAAAQERARQNGTLGAQDEEWNQRALGNANTLQSTNQAAAQGFEEGWAEGRGNVSSFIKGAFNKIVADPLRAVIGGIPWWLWLVAILGIFGYFGGFRWLKSKIKFA